MEATNFINLWIESIDFLRWGTLKLLILATLNSTIRATSLTVKYFWSLIAACILFIMMGKSGAIDQLTSFYVTGALINLYFFFFLLAVRPSIENKDFKYFFRYLPGIFIFALSITPFIFTINSIFFKIFSSLIFIPLSYATFFFLDARFSVSSFLASIMRGFFLFWYFSPGIILFTIVTFFIAIVFSLIIGLLGGLCFILLNLILPTLNQYFLALLGFIIPLVMVPFSTTATSVLYTKIKHSHFSLFFK